MSMNYGRLRLYFLSTDRGRFFFQIFLSSKMPASSGGGRKVIMFFFNTINVVVNKTNVRLSLEEKDRTTSLFLLWKISSNRCYIL